MAEFTIRSYGDPVLRAKGEPVREFGPALRTLGEAMLRAMRSAKGIGLAAPQVGVLKRVIVLDIDREDVKTGQIVMANPEIVEASDEDATYEEGCLSVPGLFWAITRPNAVHLTGYDLPLEELKLRGTELTFRIPVERSRSLNFRGEVNGVNIEGMVELSGTRTPWSAALVK